MKIQDIFEEFENKMAQIFLYQRAMRKITTKELNALSDYENSVDEKVSHENMIMSSDKMYFRRLKDGEFINFGSKKTTLGEKKQSVVLHKNKQYQWLLAEAYEEFEDYLERAYASAGFLDNNFWPLKDYGNITLDELKEKQYSWFEKQAKQKRDRPYSIMNRFRTFFPEIKELETENALEINLRVAVILVECLRHQIVHNGGIVSDRNVFDRKVLEKVGLYNNGNPEEEYKAFINDYFGNGEYANTVSLIEVPVNPEMPLDITVNRLEFLSECLLAYADQICISISSLRGKESN